MNNPFFVKHKVFLFSLFLAIFFGAIQFATLKDYGISWDETIHFRRGQAYLYYFLTGKTDYKLLPQVNLQGTNGDPKNIPVPRRSFYQSDLHNGNFMLQNDSGHPPINGELAAFSNYIFFQKLGIMDDITAHHLFNLLASSLLVFVVVFLTSRYLGLFAGIISYLGLVTYPVFFSEAHFNIKDPPEAAFFAATIWAFILSLERKSTGWLFTSILFFTLALGTKFNIVFIFLIIIPYLLYRSLLINKKINLNLPRKYLSLLLLSPLIVIGIFYLTWPYLWQKPDNILNILKYYQDIGLGVRYQPDNFFVGGFNSFPFLWVIFTTPPLVLILTVIGIVSAWLNRKNFKGMTLLAILWMAVPILRVSLPNTVIYGGIRQVLEFLPGIAIISGLGAWQIVSWVDKIFRNYKLTFFIQVILVLLFIWPTYILIKMHPNQNVYFNSLLGGLNGAQQNNFPSWGNSFGNAYKGGIDWINKNAPANAKLALIQGTPANAPAILVRRDINYKNDNWSGIERGGEYLMELSFNDTGRSYNFAWEYVDKFLSPVYEYKVDGVSILKIWKNDLAHTKPEYRYKEISYKGQPKISKNNSSMLVDLEKSYILSRIVLGYESDELSSLSDKTCASRDSIFVETSFDNKNWTREKDWIPFPQVANKDNLDKARATFYFAARRARFIKLLFNNPDSCILKNSNISVSVLE